MLSVQTPGCAGMERLGVPTRTSINSSSNRDERWACFLFLNNSLKSLGRTLILPKIFCNLFTNTSIYPLRNRRLRHDQHILSTDLSGISTSTPNKLSNLQNSRSNHHHQQLRSTHRPPATTDCSGVGVTGGVSANSSRLVSGCPHHIPLPDGEYGDDRNLQLRTQSQVI